MLEKIRDASEKEQEEGKPLEVGSSMDTTPPEVPAPERHAQHGEQVSNCEMIDWESTFKKHLEDTREIERCRAEKIERAQKKEQSWILLRECKEFLRDNEKTWQLIENEKPKMKKKQEAGTIKDTEGRNHQKDPRAKDKRKLEFPVTQREERVH